MLKKTKIVATISDLHCDVEFIRQLYENGMNVVRLNTSHQSIQDTIKVIKNVREVSDKIALILDTKGPEIRTTHNFIVHALNSLIKRNLLTKSDKVVVLGGNFEWTQSTSFIEISTVDNMLELLHKTQEG
jgi:pyruvate kinase